MKLSVIVPCFNEAENILQFHQAILREFADACYDYEVIYIDDGSKDATYHNLRKIYQTQAYPTKVIRFSRNFGKEAGIFAGLKHASGDYISVIDADLQQPVDLIRQMVNILDKDKKYDVVAAYQSQRKEQKLLSFFKKCFYVLINHLSDVQLKSHASDFRTFRRSVAQSILELGEYHRFSKGIFAWVGYETCFIPYTPEKRKRGNSKWGMKKLTNYALDGIIGYSIKPLRIATLLGGVTAVAAFLYLIAVVLEKLIAGIAIPGYATIIVLILLLGGIQLVCIGIIGEYVGRTFEQSKNRPIFIAKEILSYEKDK